MSSSLISRTQTGHTDRIEKGQYMKKLVSTLIAVAAVVGAYFAVKEIGKIFEDEGWDLFAEVPDLD